MKEIRSRKNADGEYLYHDFDILTLGYSLGGAIAQFLAFILAGTDMMEDLPLPITAITFASPGVGNKFFLKKFKWLEMKHYLRHIRVTVDGDIVPIVNLCVSAQSGVNINLYSDRKAKVKYADKYDHRTRAAKATAKTLVNANATKKCHSLKEYLKLLNEDMNSEIKTMSVNNLYSLSGATARFNRQSLASSLLKTAKSLEKSMCCCRPSPSDVVEMKVLKSEE